MRNESMTDYPLIVTEKIRYSDTDRQGHVNNVLFAVFFEAGRVAMLHGEHPLAAPGTAFVAVHTTIDFFSELHWPGQVHVGTRVERIGRSSVTSRQALFQDDRCAAVSTSVVVQVEMASRSSSPLSETARARLADLLESKAVRIQQSQPTL